MHSFTLHVPGLEFSYRVESKTFRIADTPRIYLDVGIEVNAKTGALDQCVLQDLTYPREDLMDDHALNQRRVRVGLPLYPEDLPLAVGGRLFSTRKLELRVIVAVLRKYDAVSETGAPPRKARITYRLEAGVGLAYEYKIDDEIFEKKNKKWFFKEVRPDPRGWQSNPFHLRDGSAVNLLGLQSNPMDVPAGTRFGSWQEFRDPIVERLPLPLAFTSNQPADTN